MWEGPLDGAEHVAEGVMIVPGFLDKLGIDHARVFRSMLAVPRLGAGECIVHQPDVPLVIPGAHSALKNRGRPIRRRKLWAQTRIEEGCRRYGYPGWQYAIAQATKSLATFPFLEEVATKVNSGLQTPHNHWIVPIYDDGRDQIGLHSDRLRDI